MLAAVEADTKAFAWRQRQDPGRALIIFVLTFLVSGFSKIISKPLRQVNSGQIRMPFAKTHQKVAGDFLKYSKIDSLQRKTVTNQCHDGNHEHIWIMHCSHFCCLPNIHAPILKRSEAIFLASFTSGSFSWLHLSLQNTEGTGTLRERFRDSRPHPIGE